jgi:hypothetical protein
VEFANFSFDVSEQQFESSANYNATTCFTNVVTTGKFIPRIGTVTSVTDTLKVSTHGRGLQCTFLLGCGNIAFARLQIVQIFKCSSPLELNPFFSVVTVRTP